MEVLVLVCLLLRLLCRRVDRTDLLALVVGLKGARMGGRVFVRPGLGFPGLLICACVNPMCDVKMRTRVVQLAVILT